MDEDPVPSRMQADAERIGVVGLVGLAYAAELKAPEEAPVERFDFEQSGIEGWKPVTGQWVVEEMNDAPSGKRVLVQRAIKHPFCPGGINVTH